jgi:Uma2 family endonuclease
MAAQRVPCVTPEAYLAHERQADTKSEYISGEVFAMAGGSPEHSAIATDTRRALGNALQAANRGCEVYDSDLRVRISDSGPFFYPDATIVCGEPKFDFDDCLRNPTVLIEVASESTALYDRSDKFAHYRRFATLRDYVLIEQNRMQVEHWERGSNGLWTLVGEHTEATDTLILSSLQIAIPLAEIYRRVTFPAPS